MMDSVQHPTTDDLHEFSRKVRDVGKRLGSSRAATGLGDAKTKGRERADFLAAIEELRIADEELRVQGEALAASREALDRERLRFREFFYLAPDAYLITDPRGTISEANVAAGRLFGVAPQSLAGRSLLSFFDESARKRYRRRLNELGDVDPFKDWEMWLSTRHGSRTAVSVSIARSAGDDTASEYRWIVRDITKRREAEESTRQLNRKLELRVASRTTQLAAANRITEELLLSERDARAEAEAAKRAKSDFVALLSHEFGTPLQAIFGYTELLEREIHGPLNDAQRRDLQRIRQSQQHLLGLITTILDFARLESGHPIEVHLGPTAVNEILRDMEGLIESQLEPKRVKYQYRCDDAWIAALADGAKVQQIVLNLLANAVKFTPLGGSIRLECGREPDAVAIHVIDGGIGIPADKLEAVFEPFVQVRQGNSLTIGTGLGLPISRRLATAMGGSLTATSDFGKGSTFTLRLQKAEAVQPTT